MQLFFWAARAMLLLPLICKGVKGDHFGVTQNLLICVKFALSKEEVFLSGAALQSLNLYLLWGLVVRC